MNHIVTAPPVRLMSNLLRGVPSFSGHSQILFHSFLHSCEVKSGSGLGTWLQQKLYLTSASFLCHMEVKVAWNESKLYSRKFLREKTSRILQFCGYLRKFSPLSLGAWHPLERQKRAIRESFLCENCTFHQFVKVFSLESFPLCSTWYSERLKY